MILTPKILARIVAIGLLGVLLQLSFFSRVELFHVSPDVLPALVVCLGLLGGSLTGAVSGFAIGFFVDCLLVEALGISSLVLLGIGYLAGLFRERFEIHSTLVPALLCMGLTLRRRARLRRGAAAVRHRRPGQHPDRPRHAAEERLRVLPRLADLPAHPARPASRPWSRSRGCSGVVSRQFWGPKPDGGCASAGIDVARAYGAERRDEVRGLRPRR